MNAFGKRLGWMPAVIAITAVGLSTIHPSSFAPYTSGIAEAADETNSADQKASKLAAALESKVAVENPVKEVVSQRSTVAALPPHVTNRSNDNGTLEVTVEPKLDLRKGRIESPAKKIVLTNSSLVSPADPNPPARNVDYAPKRKIEQPTEKLVAGTSLHSTNSDQATSDTDRGFDNPEVEPGNVRWHADFAAACEASRKSGKPVLLFQMMGNLDDRFC